MTALANDRIADRLDEVADLLEQQQANPFRVRAWRAGAVTVRQWEEPLHDVFERAGEAGLVALPHIGESLAGAIRELLLEGRLGLLERLRGGSDPVALFATVPGIGRATARRAHETLHLETLEDLEAAAHDGRLERLPGIGPKKLAGVRAALAQRLGRVRRHQPGPAMPPPPVPAPPVAEILDVDSEYRRRAAAGELPRIAPRRFNPGAERWLPVLHAQRGGRHYTALFSNTAHAHEAGRTRDWVVLYYDGRGLSEGQCTVITSTIGPLAGRRIVRGREAECARYYTDPPATPAGDPPPRP